MIIPEKHRIHATSQFASPQTRALPLTEKTRRVAPQRSGAPVLAKGAGEGGKRPGVLWSKAEVAVFLGLEVWKSHGPQFFTLW
jgi:hypothetical protein